MAVFNPLNSILRFPKASTLFTLFSGVCSIFGLFLVIYPLFYPQESQQGFQRLLVDGFLITLILGLISYTFYFHWRKQYLYSLSGVYFHHVSHVMRDYLGQIQKGLQENNIESNTIENEFKKVITECLDAVADLFTTVSGARCSVTYKELNITNKSSYHEYELNTYSRDKYSAKSRNKNDKSTTKHLLTENTDFDNLFFGKENCHHYYFCNDLPTEWRIGKYKNSSFNIYGNPTQSKFLTWRLNWPLAYKSTLVFPIRYIPSSESPILEEKTINANWKYWGFLCIDCSRKNIFDIRHQNDIGAAFADIFYIFFRK
jgi:hypothetical protein